MSQRESIRNKIPNCSNIQSINNKYGTCWNLVDQTILFYNKDTRNQIFEKILLANPTDDNIYRLATELVDKARCNIELLFPKHFENFISKIAFKQGSNYFERKRSYIINFFYALIERYNTKYIIEYLDKEPAEVSVLKRTTSKKCELNLGVHFYDIFELHESNYIYDYTNKLPGLLYEEFFFLNLLSIVLVDKFYYFNKATRQELSVNDGWIGLSIGIPGHAIGIFKCDDNDYKYVNNSFITNFNFNEFQRTHKRLIRHNNYTILCNDFDGIYIEQTEPLEYFYFCNKNENVIDYNKSREKKFEIIEVDQIYEYKGDKNFFLKSNERIINLVSANYRLFKEMALGKIDKVRRLCDNNEINADFVIEDDMSIFEYAYNFCIEAVPIIISCIKEYDHALEVLCEKYSTYANKTFIEENIKDIFERAHTKQIKIRRLYTLLLTYDFLKELCKQYLVREANPTFIIEEDKTKIQSLITPELAPVPVVSLQPKKQYTPSYLRNRLPAPAPVASAKEPESRISTGLGLGAWGNKYLKYKQKYLNLKNKLSL